MAFRATGPPLMSESLDNFVNEAFQELGGAEEPELPTRIGEKTSATAPGQSVLPGHAVEGLIARGGMGVVYRARQAALEREVAVKVMTALADSPEMAARFRREALVLGKLAHPNIVPVYDIGADNDGQLFYTMKLVKGRTLQAIANDLCVMAMRRRCGCTRSLHCSPSSARCAMRWPSRIRKACCIAI